MSGELEDKLEAQDEAPAEAETAAAESASAEATRLQELETDLARVKDNLVRKQAEFENYRKRVDRERQEFAAYAAAELLKDILPVLDNLERALGASGEGADARLREGVEIIYRQFQDVLRKAGLREVPAEAVHFDPHLHEAVDHIETTDHGEGMVVEVLQKGYFLRDRLLRPALVKVAKSVEDEAKAVPEAQAESEAPAFED